MTRGSKAPRRFGAGGEVWEVDEAHVDMTAGSAEPRPVRLETDGQAVTFNLRRSALVVIDMQNDFCAEGGWSHHKGADLSIDRAPIAPLSKLLPVARAASMPVIWVNWGTRPDLLNLAPNLLQAFNPTGAGIGMGDPLPGSGSHVLQKDSWSAAVVDELVQQPEDVRVDKHRVSGFWDTPLDSILRNLDVRTLFFAGVNIDQCVLCTLQDASFLGYGCILLSDCCATNSPEYCTQATLYNVQRCFGFVSDSGRLISSLEKKSEGHKAA